MGEEDKITVNCDYGTTHIVSFYNLKQQARAEVIEEMRNSILEVIKERTNAGLDDMEGADYKEFLQAEFFVVAMGVVKDEVIKALTKLSEVEK